MKKQLRELRKKIIISLIEENVSVSDISELLKISRQQIYNIIQKGKAIKREGGKYAKKK